ncbi:hypothetical protein LSAT2_023945 [Lamellibrachia satsuma]|nr:hypothetical protein LSAT2_023945 [Lamellibrachia satsuma]
MVTDQPAPGESQPSPIPRPKQQTTPPLAYSSRKYSLLSRSSRQHRLLAFSSRKHIITSFNSRQHRLLALSSRKHSITSLSSMIGDLLKEEKVVGFMRSNNLLTTPNPLTTAKETASAALQNPSTHKSINGWTMGSLRFHRVGDPTEETRMYSEGERMGNAGEH